MSPSIHYPNFSPNQNPGLSFILITNITLFILQQLSSFFFNQDLLLPYASLSTFSLHSHHYWSLISFSFLHNNFWHILLNLLSIWFVAKRIEPLIGTPKFLSLYTLGSLLGGSAWLLLNHSHHALLLGASASALALIAFFCLLNKDEHLTFLLFFFIPIHIKAKNLLLILSAFEIFSFIFLEIPGNSSIANSSHLGGILAGTLFFYLLYHPAFASKFPSISIEKPSWLKKINPSKPHSFQLNIQSTQAYKQEVDRLLDKINTHGFASLSPSERSFLENAKDFLQPKP